MKKLLILCAFIEACAVTAHYADADAVKPMVFRQSANRYSVLGEGVLATRDCTVTADGMAARVASDSRGRYIVFLDRDGEEEAECELAREVDRTVVSYPRAKSDTTGVASK